MPNKLGHDEIVSKIFVCSSDPVWKTIPPALHDAFKSATTIKSNKSLICKTAPLIGQFLFNANISLPECVYEIEFAR